MSADIDRPDREPAVGEAVSFDDVVVDGPIIEVHDPPPGLPWQEVEDFQAEQTVLANGIASDRRSLRKTAAGHPVNVVRAAAVHVLGARGQVDKEVRRLLEHPDDHVRVAAAYALARNGDNAGRQILVAMLQLPVGAYLTAPEAAGHLARLVDCRGASVVALALIHRDLTVRMVACRQLGLLLMCTFDRNRVWALFDQALADDERDVRWQAMVQLPRIDAGEARERLRGVAAHDPDAALRAAPASALS